MEINLHIVYCRYTHVEAKHDQEPHLLWHRYFWQSQMFYYKLQGLFMYHNQFVFI